MDTEILIKTTLLIRPRFLFIIRGKARAKENVYGALGAGGGGEDWRL
jgi:hypothetical protein